MMYYNAHTRMYYAIIRNDLVYVCITVRVSRPTQDRIFVFSTARFSKRLERFCSMLLLCSTTMVWTSMMLHFSFWNECVTSLPRIQSPSQPEKIEKRTSELSCYEKGSQVEELVVST